MQTFLLFQDGHSFKNNNLTYNKNTKTILMILYYIEMTLNINYGICILKFIQHTYQF